MRVTYELRYDATPEQVATMIADERFQDLKCERTGALEWEVTVETYDDGSTTVTSSRVMPTDHVPDFIQRFVGATLTLRQVEDWEPVDQDGGRGTVTVEISGAPIVFTADLTLGVQDGTCVQTVRGDLKASVPLVGSKIEKAAEPAIRAAIKAEQRTGEAWLAR